MNIAEICFIGVFVGFDAENYDKNNKEEFDDESDGERPILRVNLS